MLDFFNQEKRNIDETVYIASLLNGKGDDYGNNEYDIPKKVYSCLAPVDGSSDITVYGLRTRKMYKALYDRSLFEDVFKEGDVAYLKRVTPKGESVYGEKSNYRVESVREQNRKIVVYFEKKT